MNIDFEINKIHEDENGSPYGVFLVDKPTGITSHDVVDQYRKKFKTKRVGHAGTLDPFASGLLIILVGKCTKLSDQFLGLEKAYRAEILFGMSTDSSDPEGQLVEVINHTEVSDLNSRITSDKLIETFKEFQPSYNQYVPIFSSVKVQGNKLRELARRSDRFQTIEKDNHTHVQFYKNDSLWHEIKLPRKEVQIYNLELESLTFKNYEINEEVDGVKACYKVDLPVAQVYVKCSKGTYIRELAKDIGAKLSVPAMLINLRRVQIGDFNIEDVIL